MWAGIRIGTSEDVLPDVMHVVPVNDVIAHDTTGRNCVCGPEIRAVDGGTLVTHSSADGRELREPDYRPRG